MSDPGLHVTGEIGGTGSRRICSRPHEERPVAERKPGLASRGACWEWAQPVPNQGQVVGPPGPSNSLSAK